jgi:hypothetical protein
MSIPVRDVYLMETIGGDLEGLPCSEGRFTYDIKPHEIASFYLVCLRKP